MDVGKAIVAGAIILGAAVWQAGTEVQNGMRCHAIFAQPFASGLPGYGQVHRSEVYANFMREAADAYGCPFPIKVIAAAE